MLIGVPKNLKLTGNTFTGKYAAPAPDSRRGGAPAAAVFFNRVQDTDVVDRLEMTGNTYNITDEGTVYSLYMNAAQPQTETQTNAGADALRNDLFGTFGSKWALPGAADQTSVFKQILTAYLSDVIDAETGFVYVGNYLNAFKGFEVEQYRVTAAGVTDISCYGDSIIDGVYQWSSGTVPTEQGEPNVGTYSFYGNRTVTGGTANEFDDESDVESDDGFFYFTYDVQDTDDIP
jgi:hypothetical protein